MRCRHCRGTFHRHQSHFETLHFHLGVEFRQGKQSPGEAGHGKRRTWKQLANSFSRIAGNARYVWHSASMDRLLPQAAEMPWNDRN
jgi:hypothetical protein